jgi:hypothetical protein
MEDLAIIVCLAASLFGVGFYGGMRAERTYIVQKVLPGVLSEEWLHGCTQCRKFDENAKERDELQGVVDHPTIDLNGSSTQVP